MLERIEAPEGVLALRAVGKVERADYDDVLEPAIEAMVAERGEVRFVYVLGDAFDRYTAGAGWEDTKLGFGHLSKWKRLAVVTDHDWLRRAIEMFRWMVPGEVRVYALAGEAEAIAWAASDEASPAS